MRIIRKLRWKYHQFRFSKSPQVNLVWGFFLYGFIGWLLLSLPFLQKQGVSLLDNLFIAISAISTTGLVTIDIGSSYNLAGQVLILLLFQFGGIGYMTLTTYYLIVTTRKITPWHSRIISTEFTMPDTIKVSDFIRSAIIFTLVMEIIGAIAFFFAFKSEGLAVGRSIWLSIFHSVSAFCTAGFSLFGDSFEGFRDNVAINMIISVLAITGSMGFIVITDFWYRLKKRSTRLSFTTRIIFYGFLLLLSGGTVLIYFSEPLVHQSGSNAWLSSFFQAMTSMTTVGFNTVPIGKLTLPLLLFTTFLMYIGASPSGTAGGLKITTLTAMFAILKSRLRGNKVVSFLGRKIPYERLYVATSTFMLYTSVIFLGTFILTYTESHKFEEILFEVASSLGTVGLSTGITGQLSDPGKLIVIILMFLGRVGVLTFGFALLARKAGDDLIEREEDIAV